MILKRWTIVIIGQESGNETELSFMRTFRRREIERRFESVQRTKTDNDLTRYEIRRV